MRWSSDRHLRLVRPVVLGDDRDQLPRTGRRCDRMHPLDDGDDTAGREQPHGDVNGPPDPKTGETGTDEHDDESVGPFDQAAVAVQARSLGPCLRVRDDLRGDQADQGGHEQQLVRLLHHAPPGQAGEDRAVGDAVARGVEDRPESGTRRRGRGPSHRRACRT